MKLLEKNMELLNEWYDWNWFGITFCMYVKLQASAHLLKIAVYWSELGNCLRRMFLYAWVMEILGIAGLPASFLVSKLDCVEIEECFFLFLNECKKVLLKNWNVFFNVWWMIERKIKFLNLICKLHKCSEQDGRSEGRTRSCKILQVRWFFDLKFVNAVYGCRERWW